MRPFNKLVFQILLGIGFYAEVEAATTMWFNSSEIIPLGNGRLGAEMLGQIQKEVIVLNEDRIWSGSINDPNNKKCPVALPKIRELIWQDDLLNAQNTGQNNCMANPISQQQFQTAGNLTLTFPNISSNAAISHYNHSLDLNTAIATTTFVVNNELELTRTAFASHPDNVIVIRVAANETGKVDFVLGFVTPMDIPAFSTTKNTISMSGRGTSAAGLPGSIKFLVRANVTVSGSNASLSQSQNNTLSISGADEALIILAIDTNYVRYDDISANPEERVDQTLAAVNGKTWDQLLQTHLADYQALFGRVEISLGTPNKFTYLPTDVRRQLGSGDVDIFALYAQYGRYLAISSSRKTEASNLQGLWNSGLSPLWGSKHTININQQMNSWLAEPLNLPEILDPLWNLITEMAERGKVTALEEYNITRGWVGHHNTGIWRDSAPIDAAFYGLWPLGPAWLIQSAWEHYAFDPTPEMIQWVNETAYPLMKSLSEFYLDFLVVAPEDVESERYLVTNPSMSPEHQIATINGTDVSLTYGSTIDNSLLRDLFNQTAGFAALLDIDSDFAANLTSTIPKLIPFRIGSLGQIQEWARDYDSNGPFTHLSHMYPLFPGSQIDPRLNETLATAANVSLTLRGDSAPGWPTAWRANLFARLLDGEKAYYYMKRLLNLYSYPNLWSINIIFQIDANFGGANAVAEMILQSHNGEIHILPAIPQEWSQGSVKGFRARGGFELDIAWTGGSLTSVTIRNKSGSPSARVRYRGTAVGLTLEKGAEKVLGPQDF